MSVIAPWLRGADVIGASDAGGRLGLAARSAVDQQLENAQRNQLANNEQRIQSGDAANRLRLSYDSLAASQNSDKAALAARMKQTDAANKLRAAQMDYLSEYRKNVASIQQQKVMDAEASKTAAQKLIQAKQSDTQGFSAAVKSGMDAFSAKSKFPNADDSLVHAALTQEEKSKPSASKGALDFAAPGQSGDAASLTRFTGVSLNDPVINSVLGTNAPPGTGTNYVSPAQRLQQSANTNSAVAPGSAPKNIVKFKRDSDGNFVIDDSDANSSTTP
jgi:hypothetical protein